MATTSLSSAGQCVLFTETRQSNLTFIYFEEFKDFLPISYSESLNYRDFTHAAHCMIYAMWSPNLFSKYDQRAAVLMLLRDDGHVGFPGGTVDKKEHVIVALNRELIEEIAFDTDRFLVSEKDHVITQINHQEKFVTHFYALEVTLDEFEIIERYCLDARDHGREVLGYFRACLHTQNGCFTGFPAFLKNNFIGNCKQHLCIGLLARRIMTLEEIRASLLCAL